MAHVHQAVEAAETLAVARATVEAVVAGALDRAQREKTAAEVQLRIELAAAAAQAAQACFLRFLQSVMHRPSWLLRWPPPLRWRTSSPRCSAHVGKSNTAASPCSHGERCFSAQMHSALQ